MKLIEGMWNTYVDVCDIHTVPISWFSLASVSEILLMSETNRILFRSLYVQILKMPSLPRRGSYEILVYPPQEAWQMTWMNECFYWIVHVCYGAIWDCTVVFFNGNSGLLLQFSLLEQLSCRLFCFCYYITKRHSCEPEHGQMNQKNQRPSFAWGAGAFEAKIVVSLCYLLSLTFSFVLQLGSWAKFSCCTCRS